MYYTRQQWGARPPLKASGVVTVPITSRKEFLVHYSTGEELGREDCPEWVREIQRYHQSKGWNDIGYNVLVCKHGDVFEGRGRDVVGAHCPNHNTVGIGVCYLGNDDPNSTDATEEARAAIKSLWESASWAAGRVLARYGHRDFKATRCPGDELYAWVKSGMPVVAIPPAPPAPPPEPEPEPEPPAPAPTPEVVTLTVTLPVLREGARGKQVEMVQSILNIKAGQGLTEDGDFGPATATAVKNWQRFFGLSVDGIVGRQTWRTLIEIAP